MNHERSTREKLFADADEIVAFAQAYYATEFPNDERRACPPPDALRALARSGRLPDEIHRAHLFTCSSCFSLYRAARMPARAAAGTEGATQWQRLRHAFTFNRWLIPASAACLVLLAVIAVALWRQQTEELHIAANNPAPAPEMIAAPDEPLPRDSAPVDITRDAPPPATAPKTQNTARAPRPRAANATRRTSPSVSAPRLITVNLDQYAVLRDANENEGSDKGQVIRLPPERHRLRLRLPEGSRAGRYEISVVDAFGKTLVAATGNSNNRTLFATLDLRSLAAGDYRLSVARTGEAPDYYTLRVLDRSSRSTQR